MLVITFIIAIIALIISILAYQRTGGAKELKKTVDSLSSIMESLKDRTGGSLKEQIEKMTSVTESLRDKTAKAIGKLEAAVRRGREEKKTSRGETTEKARGAEKKTATKCQRFSE
jgi:hypothetical protein